ncbi:hypothetical protein GGI25_002996 [Coemansia spiralis]|uniref:Tetraspanin family-domain-containing protein n=2 Tax=Coemansia TaxID=4863 RepID=A0A9W8G6S7_9FUNG|nr:hypothetical protein BX070DRAFT_231029 [Coemansia spiralis]KAJ1992177.1 hypothetical protein EDC05_003006 [Coemansia umbellata]KAJ2622002.1 hypothetical protein GGI26_003578 [Coemansia sp. RSA 1358]KAJ2677606.1 hypothetical protein GGI25_002996 [Coemansia spiralis]
MRNMKTLLLALYAFVGALTGVGLCALGVYQLSTATPEFTYHQIFVSMVVLGLVIIYIFNIGTSDILFSTDSGSPTVAILTASLVLLCEMWLILSVPIDQGTIDTDFEQKWKKGYRRNPLGLQWLEHYHGCCGFRNSTDMPSSPACSHKGAVGGCLGYIRQMAMTENRRAIQWCMAAIVVQVVVLGIGALTYAREYQIDRALLIESYDDEQQAAQLNTTPAAVVAVPASRSTNAAAEMPSAETAVTSAVAATSTEEDAAEGGSSSSSPLSLAKKNKQHHNDEQQQAKPQESGDGSGATTANNTIRL